MPSSSLRGICAVFERANSTEFKQTDQNVIDMMVEQKKVKEYGGTMRLGSYPCKLEKGTKAYKAYRAELIHERHRHRYEVNDAFRDQLSAGGMIFSGLCPDKVWWDDRTSGPSLVCRGCSSIPS